VWDLLGGGGDTKCNTIHFIYISIYNVSGKRGHSRFDLIIDNIYYDITDIYILCWIVLPRRKQHWSDRSIWRGFTGTGASNICDVCRCGSGPCDLLVRRDPVRSTTATA
jgi:hypothetical protein